MSAPKICSICNVAKVSTEYRTPNRRQCKACIADKRKERKARNPERQSYLNRRSQLKTLFGISITEYDAMFAAQGGRCAICGTDQTAPRRHFSVDHCHNSGRVRGLLCLKCNVALGMFCDDPKILDRAAKYLTEN